MRTRFKLGAGAALLLAIGLVACKDKSAPIPATPAPPKPGWEYTPEDFSIGHKSTPNARCNAEIDKLREEIRQCFNAHPAGECEALRKSNTEKIGKFVKARRCAK